MKIGRRFSILFLICLIILFGASVVQAAEARPIMFMAGPHFNDGDMSTGVYVGAMHEFGNRISNKYPILGEIGFVGGMSQRGRALSGTPFKNETSGVYLGVGTGAPYGKFEFVLTLGVAFNHGRTIFSNTDGTSSTATGNNISLGWSPTINYDLGRDISAFVKYLNTGTSDITGTATGLAWTKFF